MAVFVRFQALVGHHELVDEWDVVPPAVLDLVDAVVGGPAGMGPTFAFANIFFGLEKTSKKKSQKEIVLPLLL